MIKFNYLNEEKILIADFKTGLMAVNVSEDGNLYTEDIQLNANDRNIVDLNTDNGKVWICDEDYTKIKVVNV